MAKNLNCYRSYKDKVKQALMLELKVSADEATYLIKHFETEDVFRIKVSDSLDKPVEHLIVNKKNAAEISSVSYKANNIVINARKDWKAVAATALSGISSFSGSLFYLIVGVLGALLSSSPLIHFYLDEKKTAIILALQDHSSYGSYGASEEQCLQEANEILSQYGYDQLSVSAFHLAVGELIEYNCIDQSNGYLKLIEKVTVQY